MYKIDKDLCGFIYNEMGAKYKKDPFGVCLNLDNDRNKNLEYLGTYFPRSFVESYKIFRNLFDYFLNHNFKFKDTINILDIGSGTGGQLFGLLQALQEKVAPKEINIFSVDGNKDALDIQQQVYHYLRSGYKSKVTPSFYHKVYKNKDDLAQHISNNFNNIDIIASFKFLSEMISENKGIYTEALIAAEKTLSPDGFLCLVDTTNRPSEEDNFIPILSNNEVFEYLQMERKTKLRYLLPSCCSKNIEKCKHDNCFTCCTFPVYSTVQRHIFEKINYKLFMKKGSFDDKLINSEPSDCQSQCIGVEATTCHCETTAYLEENETPLRSSNFEDSPFAFKI